jgi:hypothetical protein
VVTLSEAVTVYPVMLVPPVLFPEKDTLTCPVLDTPVLSTAVNVGACGTVVAVTAPVAEEGADVPSESVAVTV